MVDQIGSFVRLIRSLSRKRTGATDAASETSAVDVEKPARSAVKAVRGAPELRSRLRSSLAAVGTSDRERARRTFVETVLLWQLGDEVARDPAFGELVVRVADQLGSDTRVDSELNGLIAVIVA
jgi:hypothetical protein